MAQKKSDKKQWTRKELDRIRSVAEDLYINKGFSAEQISSQFDVSIQTIIRWKQGRKTKGESPETKTWDERRTISLLTPTKLKEVLMEEALLVAQGNKPKIEAYALGQIMQTIDKIDKNVNMRTITNVFINFDTWLVKNEPDKAAEFTKYHNRFIQHIISTIEE